MALPRPAALLCVLAAAAACASPDEPETGETRQALQPPPQCTEDQCGGPNSPVIAGLPFWDLNSDGALNKKLIFIIDVRRADGALMKLITVDDRLVGIEPNGATVLAEGTQLIDTRIRLGSPKGIFEVRIAYVSPLWVFDDWLWIEPYPRVETYHFLYKPAGSAERDKPLCPLAGDDETNPAVRAIAFGGERYDPVTKIVSTDDAAGWFNIACWMTLPYKIHLLGHTSVASKRLGTVIPMTKRQALVRAISMAPCDSNGASFTTAGTRITLSESQGLLPDESDYQDATGKYEAIWDHNGVVCMNWQRKVNTAEEYKVKRALIEQTCGHRIDECPTGWFKGDSWKLRGDVLTGVPLPPP